MDRLESMAMLIEAVETGSLSAASRKHPRCLTHMVFISPRVWVNPVTMSSNALSSLYEQRGDPNPDRRHPLGASFDAV
jgi:hypothetical protein